MTVTQRIKTKTYSSLDVTLQEDVEAGFGEKRVLVSSQLAGVASEVRGILAERDSLATLPVGVLDVHILRYW